MKKRPALSESLPAILQPERNCWTADTRTDDAGLLIDGRAYFRAFHDAAREARKHLLIAAWRIDSRVRILRGPDGDVALLDFLRALIGDRPDLHIYILAWNFSANYATEWEADQRELFEKEGQGRIHFRYDDQHAVAGSHHQKLVVVDGKLALVGGMDFSPGTWDDRDHPPHNPIRQDADQEPHTPYHDVQAFVSGPAAWELARYFQTRWNVATGEELPLEAVPGASPRIESSLRLPPSKVALSLNYPETEKHPKPTREIYHLYLDAIARARHSIYIENQYLTSKDVVKALQDRMEMRDLPLLEIVLLIPREFHSWVEAAALGPPQMTALDTLMGCARHTGHHLGFYYGAAGSEDGDVPIFIHSKLLIVDDRFLSVGSCNTSNRSMGMDSELNISWEATGPEDAKLADAIRDVRVQLLAEHCGLLDDPAAHGPLRKFEGLTERMNEWCKEGACRLRTLTPEKMEDDHPWLTILERLGIHFDPGSTTEQG